MPKDIKWRDREGLARQLLEVGKSTAGKGELREAVVYFSGVEEALGGWGAIREKEAPLLLESLQYLMRCYEGMGEYDRVFHTYKKLSVVMGWCDDKNLLLESHKLVGTMWWKMGMYESAREEYEAALKMACGPSRRGRRAAVLLDLASLNSEIGLFDEAEEGFSKAEAILSEIERDWRDDLNLVLVVNNRALNLEYQGRYEEAVLEYTRAVDMAVSLGNNMLQQRCRVNLARIQAVMGRLDEAEENLEKAENLDGTVMSREMAGGASLVRALLSLYRGEYEKAVGHYRIADELLRGMLSSGGSGAVAFIWGKSLREMGLEEEARVYLSEAAECFWDAGNEKLARKAEEMLEGKI
ncbi:MAG: tetratricopeptide repeat protein [Thermoplasmata archaeon]|nr:tetratricopeptide repeat protein [Thermoplasmata archaeon]